MTYDGLMAGFPPTPESLVTLANWQDPPFNRWAFRHMRELIPSQPIPAGPGGAAPLPAAPRSMDDPPVWRLDGSTATAAEVFAGTYTDALVVLHDGRLVAEQYDEGMTAATSHLLMSVSKSVVGCVAGVLADRGRLDPAAPVTAYVPEAGSSGYAGATIRNLLDMRTGVAFRETYTALDAEVRVMERSMGWRPARLGVRAGQRDPDGRPHLGADLAADRGRTGRRDHLRSAGFGHPRRRRLRHRARSGQVRADAHRRRHGPGAPGGAGRMAGRHPCPRTRRPRGLRGHRPRARPAGRLVPQSVLV